MFPLRFSRNNIRLYSIIFIGCYICMLVLLSTLPLYAEVTSLMRNLLKKSVAKRAYGFGTVMVDVTGLGRKVTKENEHALHSVLLRNFSTMKHWGVEQNACFRLSLNGSQNFEPEPEAHMKTTQEMAKRTYKSNVKLKEKHSSMRCNCYIALDWPPGRTGNQMFQVAALLGTAYNHDLMPVIPADFPLSEWFELPNVMDLKLLKAETFIVKKSGLYIPEIESINSDCNWTMRGYFQSWKYFRNAEHIIRNVFTIKEMYLNNARSFLSNVTKPGRENVCMHIRRGDLGDFAVIRKGYATADLDFIQNAMGFYRDRYKRVQFIVLSDGMIWCTENIKDKDVIFSPFDWPAEDMALMTLCDHVIVTSGTFGWWGAWLSGGTTVYYKGFPRPGSWLDSQISRHDYYPPEWIPL